MEVVVIDDDPAYRELLVLAARQWTDSVRDYPDGERALADIRAAAAGTLFVIDLHMPRISGAQLVARIRSLHPAVVIAVLSAAASERERQAMLAAGALVVLQKPIGWDRIEGCMRMLLQLARDAQAGPGPTNGPGPRGG
jgi:DNA-binding response OmpR family regulator